MANLPFTDAANWDEFYGSILGNGIESRNMQTRALTLDPMGKMPAFTDLSTFLRKSTNDGKEYYADPVDQFLHDTLGFSKETGRVETEAESGSAGIDGKGLFSPQSGGFDIGALIARLAVIAVGFIFVAAGLAMFKPGVSVVASAKNLGDGVAKNAAVM